MATLLPHQTLNFLDLNKQAPYTPTFNDPPLQAQGTRTYMVTSSPLHHASKAMNSTQEFTAYVKSALTLPNGQNWDISH